VIRLICGTTATLDAEDMGGEAIADCLGVAPPAAWPPEHNDRATRDWMRALLAQNPDEPGYACWYIVADERLVGVIGFKGPPTAQGDVEIGYSIVETEQRKGHGVAAAGLMVAQAFADPRVQRVVAETLPRLAASQKVLMRCGFVHVGGHLDAEEGQIMRFERTRA